MKRIVFLSILLLTLGIQSGMAYRWGNPEKFVTHYDIDRAFRFDNDQGRFGSGSETGVGLVEFPGYIAVNCMSCDRYNFTGSNYAVSWVEYYLKNNATGETMLLGRVNFTGGGSGNRDHIYNHECNVASITLGRGANSFIDCQKRFYDDYWDGSKWIYFLIGYSRDARLLMESAGSNLRLSVKLYFDGNKEFDKVLDTGKIIRGQASVSSPSWVDQSGTGSSEPQVRCSVHSSIANSDYLVRVEQSGRVLGRSTGSMASDATPVVSVNSASMNGTEPLDITATVQHMYSIDGTRYFCTKVGGYYPGNHTWFTLQESKTTLNPVQMPMLLSGTDELNGTVRLQWTQQSPDIGQDNSPFYVQMSYSEDFRTIAAEQQVNYVAGQSRYECVLPMLQREQGDVTCYSRLRRGKTCFGHPTTTCTTTVQTDYARILKGSLQVDSIIPGGEEGRVFLSWQATPGVWNDSLRYELSIQDQSAVTYFNNRNVHTEVSLPTCQTKNIQLRVLFNGQPISTEAIRVTAPSVRNSIISRMEASKGYYTDRVTIDWNVDPAADNFHHFIVERHAYTDNDTASIELDNIEMVAGRMHYRLEDNTCVPGTYYQYTLTGYQKCGDEADEKAIYTLRDVGFSQPFGTVSGAVTYGGNQGVQGAVVHLEGQGNQRQNSLYLPITEQDTARAWIPEGRAQNLISPTAGTVMLWARTSGDHAVLVHRTGCLTLELQEGNTLCVALTGDGAIRVVTAQLTQPEGFHPNRFNHYSVSWDSREICIYLNGKRLTATPVASNNLPRPAEGDLMLGTDGQVFVPMHLDELAFYSAAKDSDYIASHYSMYLNGNEPALEGYYRFDESIDGVCFDLSSNTAMTSYHSRHGYTTGATHDFNNTPTSTQLSYRAYTDSIGNYLIKRIPFTDAGTLYRVVPELGIHKFGPSNRQLYFNTSASTHNNMDFTDESSFKVSGHVYYDNTDYPVAGCTFYVDGQPCTKNGNLVRSGEDGSFEIQVPIGDHYIQVKKDRHSFVDDGRFPADPGGAGTLYTFDRELTTLQLYDNTKVRVMGRVAGGEREMNKAHCVGQGVNNIGVAEIQLSAGDRYHMNLQRDAVRVFDVPDSIDCNSRTTTGVFGPNSQTITIRTDSATGEFFTLLPPVSMTVLNASVRSDSSIVLRTDTFQTLNLERMIAMDLKDTVTIEGARRSVNYNQKIDLIYRREPVLRIMDQGSGSIALGESEYEQDSTSIPLYTVVNDSVHYTLGHPVFAEGRTYRWHLEVVEMFTNSDWKDSVRVDMQPWEGGIVTLENEMGERTVALRDTISYKGDSTARGGTLALSVNQLRLDSAGSAEYIWTAGVPNVMSPYLLGMRITYRDAGGRMQLAWSGNKDFQGYVLGNLQEGNQFVTGGPDELLYILRCPPGSGSTAFWEKSTGCTTVIERTTTGEGEEQDLQLMRLGTEVDISHGIGLSVITGTMGREDLTLGGKFNWARQDLDITSRKVTATERITIARTAERVGADADVFYGNSTNLLFGYCTVIELEADTTGTLHVVKKRKEGVATRLKTIFALTQRDIIHTTIPGLTERRNSLLKTVSAAEYNSEYINNDTTNIYITTLHSSDAHFGEEDTYLCIPPTDPAKRPTVSYDEISYCNSQVTAWKAYLAANERAKVTAISKGEKAFDAKAFDAANREYRKYKVLHDLYNTLLPQPNYRYRIDPSTEPGMYMGRHYKREDKMVCGGGGCANVVNYYYVQLEDVAAVIAENNYPTGDTILMVGDFYKDKGWYDLNRTIGGGVKVDVSQSTTASHTEGVNFNWSLKAIVNNDFGFTINKMGMINKLSTANGGGEVKKDNTTRDTTTVVGYSLLASTNESLTVDVYHAPDGFGPVFRTRAGQSACPYEDEQQTRYYEPGKHKLSEQTVRLENPVIRLAESGTSNYMKTLDMSDKPAGQEIPLTVRLQNASGVTSTAMAEKFNLRPLVSTDSMGLNMMIDGYALGTSGQPVTLTCGGQILQTLTVQQTNMAIADYERIGLILSSDCDPVHSADTCYLSVHFVPACAPLTLSARSLVVNRQTGDTLTLRLHDLNPAYVGLEKVMIQYRRQGSTNWFTALTLTQAQLRSDNTIRMRMEDGLFTDGEYDVRAVSTCTSGGTKVENESDILHVVRDMQRPEVIRFLPESGIYSSNNEIGIEWSKAINTGRLTRSNFHITGALNGDTVSHAVALDLSGESYTEARYLIAGISMGVEMWLRYTEGGRLLSHADSGLVARIDDEGHLVMTIGHQQYSSTHAIPRNKWCYLQFGIEQDNTGGRLTAHCRYDASVVTLFENQPVDLYYRNGVLRIGGEGMEGAMHELSVWNRIRSAAEVVQDMNLSLMTNSTSLVSYWHLNEGEGTQADDVVRRRTLHTSNSAWVLDGVNYALHVTPAEGISLPIATLVADEYTDYTLEMWFRSRSADTLMRVMSDSIATMTLSLRGGLLQVTTDRQSSPMLYQATLNSNCLDDAWHALRITYRPSGSTSFMVDNNRVLQIPSSVVGGLRGDRISFERGFTGDIDEVRLWHARTTETIAAERSRERMTGKEKGLKMCYPFEKNVVRQGIPATEFACTDACDTTRRVAYHSASLTRAASCPPLRQARVEEEVSFLYVASADKVILRPTVAAHRLEGVTLHCSVENVFDQHDNWSDPASWSVYVQRAGMDWLSYQYHFDATEGEGVYGVMYFTNCSGEVQNYTISGMPTWMSLSQSEGVLEPGAAQSVDVSCEPLSVGYHYATLLLTDNQSISRSVSIVVHVMTPMPNWTVDEQKYSGSMNIVGVMRIDGHLIDDESSVLAAFVDGECVGVAHPKYYNSYNADFVMMTIYGNETLAGKPLRFKMWDATDGSLYTGVKVQQNGVDKTVAYRENQVLGSLAAPYYFISDSLVQQSVCLDRGWNWMSFYVRPQASGIAEVVAPVVPHMRQIKDARAFSLAENGQLSGNVRSCYPYEMYKVDMTDADTLVIEGKPYNPQADEMAITLHQGWNWMGYISSATLSPAEALGDLNPENGDVLKSRRGFCIWDALNSTWTGTLSAMVPGQGYMYRSFAMDNVSFRYPGSTYYARRMRLLSNESEEQYYQPIPTGSYSTNMSIVARVLRGTEVVSEAELAGFVGTECRGTVRTSGDTWFLSAEGEEGDVLTLHVYLPETGDMVTSVTVNYLSDGLVGSLSEPLEIQLEPSAIESVGDEEQPVKFVRDGILYIRRGSHIYTPIGQQQE